MPQVNCPVSVFILQQYVVYPSSFTGFCSIFAAPNCKVLKLLAVEFSSIFIPALHVHVCILYSILSMLQQVGYCKVPPLLQGFEGISCVISVKY